MVHKTPNYLLCYEAQGNIQNINLLTKQPRGEQFGLGMRWETYGVNEPENHIDAYGELNVAKYLSLHHDFLADALFYPTWNLLCSQINNMHCEVG